MTSRARFISKLFSTSCVFLIISGVHFYLFLWREVASPFAYPRIDSRLSFARANPLVRIWGGRRVVILLGLVASASTVIPFNAGSHESAAHCTKRRMVFAFIDLDGSVCSIIVSHYERTPSTV